MDHYRIVNFHAENVKRLKVVDITPDPEQNVITITGRNGQGKTSLLDSIYWALAGQKHIQDLPIRTGEDRAKIVLDLGAYKVTRTFTEKASYISVENADGFKSTNPQQMLDGLMGSITFDPLEFTRQDYKKQYETLRGLVQLDVDIEKMDADNKADFEERTIINRQAKELEAQVAGIIVPDNAPEEPVIVAELVNQRDGLTAAVAEAAKLDGEIASFNKSLEDMEAQVRALTERITNGKALVQERQSIRNAMAVPQDSEVNDLTMKIQSAEESNRAYQARQARAAKEAEAKLKQDASEKLTKAMKDRTAAKEDALARAKMPIKGLAFADGRVLYNGVPFDQASNAEQIKISTAIAMAMNPKLRVIRIKDGSLLDDDSMDVLRAMAAEHDFQVWIERVSDNDPIAVVIEDGEVVRG